MLPTLPTRRTPDSTMGMRALFATACLLIPSVALAQDEDAETQQPAQQEPVQEAQQDSGSSDVAAPAAHPGGPEGHGHHGPGPGGMKKMMAAMRGHHDGRTDHQRVVGRWGIEVRHLSTLNRSNRSPDPRCAAGGPCVELNSFGVRHWVSDHYGWNAGLALGVGGGKLTPVPGSPGGSWDTHFGVGPSIGANFLLAQSRHVAVSANPQAELLAFLPSGTGTESIMLNVRALIEAEIHMGFIGLPQLSVGTSAGLVFNYTKKTTPDPGGDIQGGLPGPAFSAWDIGVTGPHTLWGLATDLFFRFYF